MNKNIGGFKFGGRLSWLQGLARETNVRILVLAFSISLSLSDGTLDGMPALVKNRYSDMVSSNKIFHLLACMSKNS